MSKFILPLILVFSIYLSNCSSGTNKEHQVQKTETTSPPPSETKPTTPAPSTTSQTEANPDQRVGFVIGSAMNAATAMVIACLDIDKGTPDNDKLTETNKKLQKAKEALVNFKDKNPNYFNTDTQHFKFFSAFLKLTKASDTLISKLGTDEAKNYNAALSKTYNVLGKAYGEYEF